MNLLITRHDKIGDFCITLPLFKAIKEQYSNTKVTALVSKVNFEFAKNIEFIDDVILYDKNDLEKTLQNIKDKKFDASISCFIDTALGKCFLKVELKKELHLLQKLLKYFLIKE